jgi:hypothetical protein
MKKCVVIFSSFNFFGFLRIFRKMAKKKILKKKEYGLERKGDHKNKKKKSQNILWWPNKIKKGVSTRISKII